MSKNIIGITDMFDIIGSPKSAQCLPSKAYETFKAFPNLNVAIFREEESGTTCYMEEERQKMFGRAKDDWDEDVPRTYLLTDNKQARCEEVECKPHQARREALAFMAARGLDHVYVYELIEMGFLDNETTCVNFMEDDWNGDV